jgi:hypothetical protein
MHLNISISILMVMTKGMDSKAGWLAISRTVWS